MEASLGNLDLPACEVTCPFCQQRLKVPPSAAGETTACPKCSGKFQVPLPTAVQDTTAAANVQSTVDPAIQSFAGKKIAAGICGILLGGMGVHKFILGLKAAGAIMLSVWLVGIITGTCLVIPLLGSLAMNMIGLVEGILYLTKSDEEFYQTYGVQRKEWF